MSFAFLHREAARTPPDLSHATADLVLASDEDSPRAARHAVRELCRGRDSICIADAELVVSELVTNAVVHATGDGVTVRSGCVRRPSTSASPMADSASRRNRADSGAPSVANAGPDSSTRWWNRGDRPRLPRRQCGVARRCRAWRPLRIGRGLDTRTACNTGPELVGISRTPSAGHRRGARRNVDRCLEAHHRDPHTGRGGENPNEVLARRPA